MFLSEVIKAVSIDPSLYKFDFVSPRWSPDMAGFFAIICVTSRSIYDVQCFYYFYTRRAIHAGK